MTQANNWKPNIKKVADIIHDAGGKVVGRTRLQKLGFLLELSGLGEGFSFEYRHYGPYSEELAAAARDAKLLGLVSEEEYPTSWGGFYSVFKISVPSSTNFAEGSRFQMAREAVQADPIELELAATEAFLSIEGTPDPWKEVAKRKPEKAGGGRLENAKALYRRLQHIKTPKPLPQIG
jgi:hypothetical protein